VVQKGGVNSENNYAVKDGTRTGGKRKRKPTSGEEQGHAQSRGEEASTPDLRRHSLSLKQPQGGEGKGNRKEKQVRAGKLRSLRPKDDMQGGAGLGNKKKD